jgi:hypothetical protein
LNGGTPWYAGRFVRRRGAHGAVDVLALATDKGWEAIKKPRKLFPKSGQAEILGVAVSTLRPGDWLAFQVANSRPDVLSLKISAHRVMPRYVDMAAIGSIEAARVLFANEGWAGGWQAGHWAVRFASDGILVVDLARERGDRLRVPASSLQRIPCYNFDAHRIISEPGIEHPVPLYDLGDTEPLAVHDWSADADYIAHVVRSLAGEDDPRLGDLIAWLELHRDESTGRVSATRANHEKAFEAIRSGELAARLSADKTLMATYLAAVRDDPVIAQVAARAAAQLSAHDREAVIAALRSELAAAHESEKSQQDDELKERERRLEEALQERMRQRSLVLQRELECRSVAAAQEAEARAAATTEALEAAVAEISSERNVILAERDRLQLEASQLTNDVAALVEKRRAAEDEVARLSVTAAALAPRSQAPARTLAHLSETHAARGTALTIEGLGAQISRVRLLTDHGKALMERFAIFMLAGELPVLEGDQADDFAFIGEALMAAGGLVPFDADATILAPEDIWSRPGSGIESPVAQAADLARNSDGTFLVQLRGIERSAARIWYPALATLLRRGLLPRRLLLFATVIDTTSEEAQALPNDACRMVIEDAIVTGAALVAPSVLSAGSASTAFHLDPGDRPADLSSALAVLPELGVDIDIATSLRVARVAVEASRLRPDNNAAALATAREFCSAIRRVRSAGQDVAGGRKNA